MLNLQIVSFWEELWKDNTKTFRTNVFKGQTDNAFVFLCKGLWQPLCFSLFSLWILSAFTFFYCSSCCGFFVGAFLICSFSGFGGLLLKMVKKKFSAILLCILRFSPKTDFSERDFLSFLSIWSWNAYVHVVVQLSTGKPFACSLMLYNKDSHNNVLRKYGISWERRILSFLIVIHNILHTHTQKILN